MNGENIDEIAQGLAGGAFAPIVAEEALASSKANKFAKETLSPELFKKVAKGNKIGLLSYVAFAAATAIGIGVGSKIRDNIVESSKK